MPTTREDIRRWLSEAATKHATHMVVATDTFDYEDYPVFVGPGERVKERVEEISNQPMTKIMEVYSLGLPLEAQLDERRAYHIE